VLAKRRDRIPTALRQKDRASANSEADVLGRNPIDVATTPPGIEVRVYCPTS